MIQKLEFGATGHHSTRIIFGAAALGAMSQDRANRVLESVFENGVNHIDVAASYGEAEDRLAPWLRVHRKDVFLATKTGERGYEKARASIHLSLERMGIEQLDMIQLHNLTDEPGWQQALGHGGCLEAAVEAREEGLVRFIGITGHGTQAAAMHLKSLERFDFDSVLTPYNPSMMQDPHYAADFERLARTCRERNVAVQTIKAIARRRWRDEDTSKRFSWYEPIRDPEALRRAVQYVLYRPGVFLNTTSDATLLPQIFEAAGNFDGDDPDRIASLLGKIEKDADALAIEPLFVRGVSEDVLLSSN
jgi:aryl-alcohol dehydrogenase-like predicted oxidoreductase